MTAVDLSGTVTVDDVTPIDDDGEALLDAARRLKTHYEQVLDDAKGAGTTWSGLPDVLTIDQVTPLLAPMMTPAVTHAMRLADAADSFYRAAAYAAGQIADLKREHDQLVTDIESFRQSAAGKAESHIAQQLASGDILGALGTAIASWRDIPALVAEEASLRWRIGEYETSRSNAMQTIVSRIDAIDAPTASLTVGASASASGTASVPADDGGGHWWDGPLDLGKSVVGGAEDLGGDALDLGQSAVDGVTDAAGDAWNWTKDAGGDAWDWSRNAGETAWPYIQDIGAGLGNGLASFGNAMTHNPQDLLGILGGIGLMAVGSGGEALGGALDATGVGAIGGVPLNVVSAAAIASGAGLTAASTGDLVHHAMTDDQEHPYDTNHVDESREPNPNHPGRDKGGRFTSKDNDAARGDAAQKEQQGLDDYAKDTGRTVDGTKVAARTEENGQVRYFDGLARKEDGTYEGIEVKSGGASRTPQQRDFDNSISEDHPAYATLDGKTIKITSVDEVRVK